MLSTDIKGSSGKKERTFVTPQDKNAYIEEMDSQDQNNIYSYTKEQIYAMNDHDKMRKR